MNEALVALTGIWDWFDGGRSKEIQQHAVVALPKEFQYGPKAPPVYVPKPFLPEDAPPIPDFKKPFKTDDFNDSGW
jgi:hypothetical protein